MTTFDQTYGRVAGLQSSGLMDGGSNIFELDFAQAILDHPTLAATDIITIGKLKKGMTLLPASAKVLVASTTTGASDLDIQDGSAVKIITGLGIDTLNEVGLSSVAASAYFGQTTSHPVQLSADMNVNVLIGATLPLDGKIRVAFPVFQGANY